MQWHSLNIDDHRSTLMRALKKLKICEERAIIDQVVLIKLTIQVSRTKSLKTHARNFEEECCIYNLGLKWRRLNKWKEYHFTLENMEKLPIFCMESVVQSECLKTFTEFRQPTHDFWKIYLFSLRICKKFTDWSTWTTILLVGLAFKNCASWASELLFYVFDWITMIAKTK